jgi:hypothetical protein
MMDDIVMYDTGCGEKPFALLTTEKQGIRLGQIPGGSAPPAYPIPPHLIRHLTTITIPAKSCCGELFGETCHCK